LLFAQKSGYINKILDALRWVGVRFTAFFCEDKHMSRIISPPPTPMLQGGMPPLTDGTIAKGPAQGGGTIQGSPQGSEGVAKGEATAQTNPSSTVSPTQAPQKGSFEAHQTTKLLGAEAPTLGNLLGKDDILSSAGLSKAGLGFLIAEKALEKGKMEGDVGKADGKAGTAIGFGDLGGKLKLGKDAKADPKGQEDKGLLAPKSTPQARTIQRSVLQGASEGTRTAQGDSLSSQNTAKGASVGMSGQTKAAHATGMADPLGSGGAKLTSSNGTLATVPRTRQQGAFRCCEVNKPFARKGRRRRTGDC
jgi:hypothetical protein